MKLHAHKKNGLFGHAINLKPCTSILNVIITQQCGCLIRETGKKKNSAHEKLATETKWHITTIAQT